MCFVLVRAAVHGLPSLFISLYLNGMLRDIKVMLQANKVFKAPGVPVQGATGWGEDTWAWREGEGDRKVERKGRSLTYFTHCVCVCKFHSLVVFVKKLVDESKMQPRKCFHSGNSRIKIL